MANRAIDFLITYRVIKLLVTPFNKQEAYAFGIIDDKGKVLKKFKTLKTPKEKKAYTFLHRFIFNLKRILQKVGLGGKLGSFAVALALLIKEDKSYVKYKDAIESGVISYLKENKMLIAIMLKIITLRLNVHIFKGQKNPKDLRVTLRQILK